MDEEVLQDLAVYFGYFPLLFFKFDPSSLSHHCVFVLKLATVELSNNLETELFYSDSRIEPAGLLHTLIGITIIVYDAVIFQDAAY